MGQESIWVNGQDGLLSFTLWKSLTNSEQQEKTNGMVKMGQESRWTAVAEVGY